MVRVRFHRIRRKPRVSSIAFPSENVCQLLSVSGLILVLFVGCTGYTSNPDTPDLSLSTTGVSAATGAALGAGLGAIIGSATGDAGAGLAIGAAGGAVAGGLVGHKLEKHEEQIAQQDELLTRQSEQISEQGRKLEDLKSGMRDQGQDATPWKEETITPSDRMMLPEDPPVMEQPSSVSQNDNLFEIPKENAPSKNRYFSGNDYVGSPQAELWASQPLEDRAEKREAMRSEVRARMGVTEKIVPIEEPETPVIEESLELARPATSSTDNSIEQKTMPSPELPPAKEFASTEAEIDQGVEETTTDVPLARLPKESDSEEFSTQSEPVAEPKALEAVSLPDDANCGEAEREAARARNATSDADKLFYFRRALRLCPAQPVYHIEMGRVFSSIGRADDARFEFNKALELDPENEVAQDELSVLMLNNVY